MASTIAGWSALRSDSLSLLARSRQAARGARSGTVDDLCADGGGMLRKG